MVQELRLSIPLRIMASGIQWTLNLSNETICRPFQSGETIPYELSTT
jgi:hypothetical protein